MSFEAKNKTTPDPGYPSQAQSHVSSQLAQEESQQIQTKQQQDIKENQLDSNSHIYGTSQKIIGHQDVQHEVMQDSNNLSQAPNNLGSFEVQAYLNQQKSNLTNRGLQLPQNANSLAQLNDTNMSLYPVSNSPQHNKPSIQGGREAQDIQEQQNHTSQTMLINASNLNNESLHNNFQGRNVNDQNQAKSNSTEHANVMHTIGQFESDIKPNKGLTSQHEMFAHSSSELLKSHEKSFKQYPRIQDAIIQGTGGGDLTSGLVSVTSDSKDILQDLKAHHMQLQDVFSNQVNLQNPARQLQQQILFGQNQSLLFEQFDGLIDQSKQIQDDENSQQFMKEEKEDQRNILNQVHALASNLHTLQNNNTSYSTEQVQQVKISKQELNHDNTSLQNNQMHQKEAENQIQPTKTPIASAIQFSRPISNQFAKGLQNIGNSTVNFNNFNIALVKQQSNNQILATQRPFMHRTKSECVELKQLGPEDLITSSLETAHHKTPLRLAQAQQPQASGAHQDTKGNSAQLGTIAADGASDKDVGSAHKSGHPGHHAEQPRDKGMLGRPAELAQDSQGAGVSKPLGGEPDDSSNAGNVKANKEAVQAFNDVTGGEQIHEQAKQQSGSKDQQPESLLDQVDAKLIKAELQLLEQKNSQKIQNNNFNQDHQIQQDLEKQDMEDLLERNQDNSKLSSKQEEQPNVNQENQDNQSDQELSQDNQDEKELVKINNGKWSDVEHYKFLQGLKKYGKNWHKIQKEIGTRTCPQTRSHAQKFFRKVNNQGLLIVPSNKSQADKDDLDTGVDAQSEKDNQSKAEKLQLGTQNDVESNSNVKKRDQKKGRGSNTKTSINHRQRLMDSDQPIHRLELEVIDVLNKLTMKKLESSATDMLSNGNLKRTVSKEFSDKLGLGGKSSGNSLKKQSVKYKTPQIQPMQLNLSKFSYLDVKNELGDQVMQDPEHQKGKKDVPTIADLNNSFQKDFQEQLKDSKAVMKELENASKRVKHSKVDQARVVSQIEMIQPQSINLQIDQKQATQYRNSHENQVLKRDFDSNINFNENQVQANRLQNLNFENKRENYGGNTPIMHESDLLQQRNMVNDDLNYNSMEQPLHNSNNMHFSQPLEKLLNPYKRQKLGEKQNIDSSQIFEQPSLMQNKQESNQGSDEDAIHKNEISDKNQMAQNKKFKIKFAVLKPGDTNYECPNYGYEHALNDESMQSPDRNVKNEDSNKLLVSPKQPSAKRQIVNQKSPQNKEAADELEHRPELQKRIKFPEDQEDEQCNDDIGTQRAIQTKQSQQVNVLQSQGDLLYKFNTRKFSNSQEQFSDSDSKSYPQWHANLQENKGLQKILETKVNQNDLDKSSQSEDSQFGKGAQNQYIQSDNLNFKINFNQVTQEVIGVNLIQSQIVPPQNSGQSISQGDKSPFDQNQIKPNNINEPSQNLRDETVQLTPNQSGTQNTGTFQKNITSNTTDVQVTRFQQQLVGTEYPNKQKHDIQTQPSIFNNKTQFKQSDYQIAETQAQIQSNQNKPQTTNSKNPDSIFASDQLKDYKYKAQYLSSGQEIQVSKSHVQDQSAPQNIGSKHSMHALRDTSQDLNTNINLTNPITPLADQQKQQQQYNSNQQIAIKSQTSPSPMNPSSNPNLSNSSLALQGQLQQQSLMQSQTGTTPVHGSTPNVGGNQQQQTPQFPMAQPAHNHFQNNQAQVMLPFQQNSVGNNMVNLTQQQQLMHLQQMLLLQQQQAAQNQQTQQHFQMQPSNQQQNLSVSNGSSNPQQMLGSQNNPMLMQQQATNSNQLPQQQQWLPNSSQNNHLSQIVQNNTGSNLQQQLVPNNQQFGTNQGQKQAFMNQQLFQNQSHGQVLANNMLQTNSQGGNNSFVSNPQQAPQSIANNVLQSGMNQSTQGNYGMPSHNPLPSFQQSNLLNQQVFPQQNNFGSMNMAGNQHMQLGSQMMQPSNNLVMQQPQQQALQSNIPMQQSNQMAVRGSSGLHGTQQQMFGQLGSLSPLITDNEDHPRSGLFMQSPKQSLDSSNHSNLSFYNLPTAKRHSNYPFGANLNNQENSFGNAASTNQLFNNLQPQSMASANLAQQQLVHPSQAHLGVLPQLQQVPQDDLVSMQKQMALGTCTPSQQSNQVLLMQQQMIQQMQIQQNMLQLQHQQQLQNQSNQFRMQHAQNQLQQSMQPNSAVNQVFGDINHTQNQGAQGLNVQSNVCGGEQQMQVNTTTHDQNIAAHIQQQQMRLGNEPNLLASNAQKNVDMFGNVNVAMQDQNNTQLKANQQQLNNQPTEQNEHQNQEGNAKQQTQEGEQQQQNPYSDDQGERQQSDDQQQHSRSQKINKIEFQQNNITIISNNIINNNGEQVQQSTPFHRQDSNNGATRTGQAHQDQHEQGINSSEGQDLLSQ